MQAVGDERFMPLDTEWEYVWRSVVGESRNNSGRAHAHSRQRLVDRSDRRNYRHDL